VAGMHRVQSCRYLCSSSPCSCRFAGHFGSFRCAWCVVSAGLPALYMESDASSSYGVATIALLVGQSTDVFQSVHAGHTSVAPSRDVIGRVAVATVFRDTLCRVCTFWQYCRTQACPGVGIAWGVFLARCNPWYLCYFSRIWRLGYMGRRHGALNSGDCFDDR